MLTVSQISKSYGIDPILNQISFTLNPGERLGLVGPNGCGKTTLMRIITGAEMADQGSVRLSPASLRLGYLPQGFTFASHETLGSYLDKLDGELPSLSQRLEELALLLANEPDQPALQAEFDQVLTRIETAAESAGRAPAVLAAMGLAKLPPDLPVSALSGGQKTRLALAGVLLSNPQLLVLDEPTNHLDIQMLEWLENWLVHFPSAALITSHDRAFLDRVATGIIEIDAATHEAKQYPGNYSDYLDAKNRRTPAPVAGICRSAGRDRSSEECRGPRAQRRQA
jgi:ATPase subunit of ABC transporter with duplicated ATPase domains